ncbi:MAG: sugar phosphate isomerase/epimerase [Oscillospiraceae bacterium]|nr:sugar phosphate isomerase/epimerase [Oscillospiraceae bacterium]
MQVTVSSYSFYQKGQDLLRHMRWAKELGFAGIEFLDTNREMALRLREESERIGLPIVCYTVGADFLRAESVESEAARLQAQVDIADILGVRAMRHDATGGWPKPLAGYRGFAQALPLLAKGCRAVTEYAAAKGIATMVENHGFFCQDSARVLALVEAVNHPNFGTLVDIGNFCCADEDPARAVGNVAAFVRHAHAKDFHIKSGTEENPGEGWFKSRAGNYLRGAVVGHGNVPVRQCLQTLRRAGYDGCVSIEFEGMEDCLTALRIGKANLENLIST